MVGNLSYKINSCAIVSCSPGWTWESSGHNDYDLWTVFGGEGTLVVGGEAIAVKAGTSLLLPPNETIHGTHNPNKPLSVINVHFDFLDEDNALVYPYELQRRYIISAVFFRELLCKVILYFYQEQEKEAKLYFSVAFNEFWNSPQIEKPDYANGEHVSLIQSICRSINEDIASNTSLSEIAIKHGYCPTYLGKIFHSVTGVSFSSYIRSAKINQAKTFLRTSDLSVGEISERLGYYDACHFVKQFKNIVGCSPIAYKRGQKI